MKRFWILPLTVVMAVSGCSNGDISTVQKATLNENPSFTVGQAFGNRKVCESVKWDQIKDDRGRKIVEYRCSFNKVDDYVNSIVDNANKSLANSAKNVKDQYDSDITNRQNAVIQQQKSLSDAASNPSGTTNTDVTPERIKSLSNQLADLKAANLQAILTTHYANSDDPLSEAVGQYQGALANAKKEADTGNAARASMWEGVATRQNEAVQRLIPSEIEMKSRQLDELQRGAQHLGELQRSSLEGLNKQLAADQDALKQKVAGRGDYFASVDKDLKDKIDLAKPKNPLAHVSEVFQWVLSEDGTPSMVYAGTEMTYRDATVKSHDYSESNAQAAIQLIIKNDATTYAQYTQEFGALSWLNFIQN